jgi:hypothetical protein
MEQIIKDFIIAFAGVKNIPVEQLISIELGQKLKYVYVDGNAVHLVEEAIQYEDATKPTE